MTSPTIRLIQRKRRIKRKLRRQARVEGPPMPLSLPALAVFLFGNIFWFGPGPLTFTAWGLSLGSETVYRPEMTQISFDAIQLARWAIWGFITLMVVQIISEYRRPWEQRRLRRSRRACDIFALITMLWMAYIPWLMEYCLEVGRNNG
jgi:hypothetical protein